jgi:hypothetical protein
VVATRSSRDKMRGCGGSGSGAEADLMVLGSLYIAMRFLDVLNRGGRVEVCQVVCEDLRRT